MTPKQIVWLIVALGIEIAVVGSTILLFKSREASSLQGVWIARMDRAGQPPSTIRLRLFVDDTALTGHIEYPDRTDAILNGTVDDRRLTFATKEVGYSGEIRGREIVLTATTPDGSVATGRARKTQ